MHDKIMNNPSNDKLLLEIGYLYNKIQDNQDCNKVRSFNLTITIDNSHKIVTHLKSDLEVHESMIISAVAFEALEKYTKMLTKAIISESNK